ncbi:4-alpha-glucanotransferase [Pontibacter pudoricolor]|uniref:4-alpha-glucanotransferase n=1 Tax=Pontibacter pudoricolor TaxID=2694930 RepID=UPI001390C48A|nr:4-alpha-glucanotransferase [Pontibacter pudoricolor]
MIIPHRSCGILLHITSLPSKYGIGDLGPEAYTFADQLEAAGQRYWQILPLNPTETGMGNSPYSSHSAFAGNPLLLSPDLLVEDGLLEKKDLKHDYSFPDDKVDYEAATAFKREIWKKAFDNYKSNGSRGLEKEFEAFRREHSAWLEDYSQFVVFQAHFDHNAWAKWDKVIKTRKPIAIKALASDLADEIEKEQFLQFLFYRQWENLKQYCHRKDIHFIGDMPFYVSYDSADVWANPEYFKLDKDEKPSAVSGVPPDFFSETGQLWGTPVYNWKALAKHNYDWWLRRIDHNLQLFSLLRLDHFRAFSAYWEVPATEETAINGKWVKSPGKELLTLIRHHHPEMPIIAEDLGEIDQPVRDLIKAFDLPGMLVLLFAFESNEHAFESSFLPHNHTPNSVVYTGTHDNATVKAWYKDAKAADRKMFSNYVHQEVTQDNVHEVMLQLAYSSVSRLAIVPMQDVLGLGHEGIMNKPSTSNGNWEWRLQKNKFNNKVVVWLRRITEIYGRI